MIGPSSFIVRDFISTLMRNVNANNALEPQISYPLPLDCPEDYAAKYDQIIDLIQDALFSELSDKRAHRQRNALQPVGKLPTELLIEIFSKYVTSVWGSGERKVNVGLVRDLGQVCSRWWQVVVSTPLFWVNIYPNSIDCLRTQLLRSGNLPLSIDLWQHDPRHPSVAPLLRVAAEHGSRWRKLSLYTSEDEFEEMAAYLAGSKNLLEEVELMLDGDGMLTPFGGGPKLRTLTLSRLLPQLNYAPNAFTSLEILRLDGCRMPDSTYLFRLLQQCPGLVELGMEGLTGAWGHDWQGAHRVSLPSLGLLDITLDNDQDLWVPLLRGIHAENLKRLLVGDQHMLNGFDPLAYPSGGTDLPSLLQTVLKNVELREITIEAGVRSTFFSVYDGVDGYARFQRSTDSQRVIDIEVVDDSKTGVNALRHVSFGTTNIHLGLGEGYHPTALHFIPGVVSLTLAGHTDMGVVQEYIVTLASADEESGTLPCPRLQELHLETASKRGHTSVDNPVEAYENLAGDIQRLIGARRSVGGSQMDGPRGMSVLRVTCGKARCRFDEDTGRFVNVA